jgi:hypothetical protein
LFLLLVLDDLKFFTVELGAIDVQNSCICLLLILILDIGKAPACAILVVLKFAGLNTAKFRENVKQFLLSHVFVQILDNNVSLFVKLLFALGQKSDSMAFDDSIIHFFHASVSFFLSIKAEISESSGLASFLVKNNLSLGNLVLLASKELVKI